MRALADADICLDVYPTSNVALRASPAIEQHQLPGLLRSGVSLGSDCPAFSGADLLDEYLGAHHEMGLDKQETADIACNSISHSAAPGRLQEESAYTNRPMAREVTLVAPRVPDARRLMDDYTNVLS